jgi:dTDP-4-dehydrorhamnose 3,5-epimerase
MIFSETRLKGAYLIEPEAQHDHRGQFARTWCQQESQLHGIEVCWVQSSISVNTREGTLRGLHFQAEPHTEVKLVRCTRGAIYDVVVDLRTESPTFRQWLALELTADNRRMLYVPKGFAHGFQTLSDQTEVFYEISEFYRPASAKGVRWNDPAFGIEWPSVGQRIMSKRDEEYPDFRW